MSKSRQKGTAAETAVVNFLNEKGIRAKRNPLSGSKDVGDIDVSGLSLVVEVKNCKTMKLSEWVDEANKERDNAGAKVGLVWHKRVRRGSPGEWYVTMDGNSLLKLLAANDMILYT